MEKLLLQTFDENQIVAHLFKPEKSNHKLLLINSATGVKQQIYFSFAQFLASKGFTVLTYDYRGIGLSKPQKMRNYKASMRIWGTRDYKALTLYIIQNFPAHQKFCLGHSVGALILGMNKDSFIFNEFLFVGTQNAFIGNLKWRTKIEALLGFGIVQPLFTELFGYFPANWFSLGESLPKNCAYDWRTLILNRKSTNKLLLKTDDFSKDLNQKVFVIQAEDDVWLTEKGIKSLLNETYPNLKPTYRLIKTSESAKGEIGHVNFFRSYNKNLWEIIVNEIE
ncbi:alpha/beta hydrolase family protein [Chryseobacterium chendengshani]|uniref:alpha/beta hydrolase family protein n=1 Tax=unclassified Chryseobacterium TaxID=2593645 RepID=UPI001C643738|nr:MULTISPECIES: alpha/beta fold hydrolase [unclassified Chryseobacterium]MBW7676583.1 alpha/beta fold hydrolase [Chryseobacterium sp. LJ756]MBW8523125.1 alpha/beta fold hydrolase [Chryseobacterium sp. LJ668]QYK15424.1 alpha/beta fold hydrolase [Chryseobacterium sp. LJ668]